VGYAIYEFIFDSVWLFLRLEFKYSFLDFNLVLEKGDFKESGQVINKQ